MAKYRLTAEGRAQLAALLAADGAPLQERAGVLHFGDRAVTLPDSWVEWYRPAEPGPGVYQMGENVVFRHPDDDSELAWILPDPGPGGVMWKTWPGVCDLYPDVEPVARWTPDMPSTVDGSPTVVWACTEPGCTTHIAYPREQGDGGMVLEHMEEHLEAHRLDRDEEPEDGSVVHITYEGRSRIAERDDAAGSADKVRHWYPNDIADNDGEPYSWHGLTKGAVRIALMTPARIWEA